ncbi:ATP-binding cassette domain-containing protein [Actinoplanes sp. NPDC049599]|uniref:ATP-binding cassette domain-containing protein n=1 Tax=Actinoplanes sp. NPDC049599 TaxID=3363903 RepID=UPI0037BD8C28
MRFDQVWFRYARRAEWALRTVNATVEPGATVVVLGRNGAGKSTLLQLAAGVLRPHRGAVRDRPRTVGWVPERFPADQPFTAGQYLRRMAALRGLRGTAEIEHWVERLGLGEHRHTRLAGLSKGTAQKVGLAQALLVPPGLLVLDEPWEGLDSVARTLIPQIVAEVTAAGGAVLVSDHRGEITGLPEAIRWTVAAGAVHTGGPAESDADEVVVEVAVRRADADDTVARLRAEGHQVLGVRDPERPQADSTDRPPATAPNRTPNPAGAPNVAGTPDAAGVPKPTGR